MARIREPLVGQSIMERLSEAYEQPNTQAASLRVLKEAIRRDLEAVLNTRRQMGAELDGYSQAAGSVLNFGVEDLSSLRADPEGYLLQMQRAVQKCVMEYEPRLADISVTVQDAQIEVREIRLHIEAQLILSRTGERVSFDTIFDVSRETYSVGS